MAMPAPHRRSFRTLVQYDAGVPSGSSDMDDKIWRNLPMDILERVFHLLPLAQILRWRTVCKDWRCLLSSAAFLEHWRRNAVVPLGVFVEFLSEGRQPRVLPPWLKLRKFMFLAGTVPCAASGGLMCFWRGSLSQTFFIFNPLTGDWKRLPILPYTRAHPSWTSRQYPTLRAKLVVDYANKSYALQLVWNKREMFTYDSVSGSWASSDWTPPPQYCVPEPESSYYSFRQVETPQAVYKVGIHLDHCNFSVDLSHYNCSVGIWKADPWELVSMMPQADCKELLKNCQNRIIADSVAVIEHYICFYLCLNGRRIYPPFSLGVMGLITYDLTTKRWGSWLVDFYENIPGATSQVPYPIFSLNPMASQIAL